MVRTNTRSPAVGGAVGLLAAFGASSAVSHFLYGVGSRDPVAFLGVVALLVTVCASAAYIPDRRVTRIAPIQAIAQE